MLTLAQRVRGLQQPAGAGDAPPVGLTARELQVLRMVFHSANTVANHVHSILAKIGAANRTDAAAFAARHRLLERR
ncbi:MAG: response regulator transcription factor [Methylibium sp.]|uniref:response regulator transcription factor n=1 Tax=Methylibium sp. TaxID=2067992 RepID=UPI001822F7B1|nr:hypothetical protein [Methylibium sp.]MBA3596840.1 response regulator transcription factor [Methylibium sp.]